MNTSEVLDLAADEIERRGWAKGFRGGDPWGGGSAGTGPVCLEGALGAALGLNLSVEGIRCMQLWPSAPYIAVAQYLGRPRDEEDGRANLWAFNDTPQRTAAEVIEVLRAAAMVERTREAALAVSA